MSDETKGKKYVIFDGNTAAAHVAYAFSDVAAIYPITPSSGMGELADEWSAAGKLNIFGQKVDVVEMQSEGGAAGAIHGALSVGALTTTFTASQGLLLMLPNMYKIASEMLPTVFHVASRSLATQGLSIFGDHSDVMSARATGYAMLASASVQESMDLAAVSHLSTLDARIPFLHFFDGFRTSHELQKIEAIDYDTLKSMINQKAVEDFRNNALSPNHPVIKVGAENPDVYFQGRETVNKYYTATPAIVKKYMDLVFEKTGRRYNLFDYIGSQTAEKIIISMGSSNEVIEEAIEYLNNHGYSVGAIKVRLFRPFSIKDFIDAIPSSVKKIAVLDRTKEPGAIGEPLYMDVVAALKDKKDLTIIGGRYGLSSKEFTPAMVKAVYDHLDNACFHDFVVGINDDVTFKSLEVKENIDSESDVVRCKFWGYGSDGTVSANKNALKIIGNNTDMFVQGYFSYDSKKAGGITISHLRFGKHKIHSSYMLHKSNFIALHKASYIGRYDILEGMIEGGVFLLNSPWTSEEVFERLTEDMQKTIIEKKIKFYNIDASKIAQESGLGNRINTVMQAAFFKISGILPEEQAIALIKKEIEKTFKRKGEEIVKMNWDCVDKTSAALKEIIIPASITKFSQMLKLVPDNADRFTKDVILRIMNLKGDDIPVSQMTLDGSVPSNTGKLEKRGISDIVPKWISEHCIQCGICAYVCPHGVIRLKQFTPETLKEAPSTFNTIKSNTKNTQDLQFKVQVSIEDCTGCNNCVVECPTKEKSLVMVAIEKEREAGENDNWTFFEKAPENIIDGASLGTIKGSQLKTPLFEFSGACSGCGETPYIKLMTQLFGERMIIANATGCSSIYGGTFPTTPYAMNKQGKGPAWANSLFEDNAEYGFGFRLAVTANRRQLKANMENVLKEGTNDTFKAALEKMITVWDKTDDEANTSADNVLKNIPGEINTESLRKVNELKDFLIDRSIWIVGGDGWAYDIGFGGLDHVLAAGKKVNMLVLDTEGYSNTGGQASKSTPRGAIAKFASSGKEMPKKNLGLMMMSYGTVYVAQVNMGGNMQQTLKAFAEAESYPGPSIIIAYSPCIAHGIDMNKSTEEGKKASQSGYWPLYRYDPRNPEPLKWDSTEPNIAFKDYLNSEIRYKSLSIVSPDKSERLYKEAEDDAKHRYTILKNMKNETKKE